MQLPFLSGTIILFPSSPFEASPQTLSIAIDEAYIDSPDIHSNLSGYFLSTPPIYWRMLYQILRYIRGVKDKLANSFDLPNI
jgi:hypothetical protein